MANAALRHSPARLIQQPARATEIPPITARAIAAWRIPSLIQRSRRKLVAERREDLALAPFRAPPKTKWRVVKIALDPLVTAAKQATIDPLPIKGQRQSLPYIAFGKDWFARIEDEAFHAGRALMLDLQHLQRAALEGLRIGFDPAHRIIFGIDRERPFLHRLPDVGLVPDIVKLDALDIVQP